MKSYKKQVKYMQNIIFFGSGDYTIPVVERLLNYNLLLVITTEKDGPLVKFCESKGVNYISTDLKDENDIKVIQNVDPTVAVLASYGAFIPKEVIESIPNGIINIHPSLLPKWKGPSPIQYTLLNGDTQTGVTLIKLDNEIDHGPVLAQRKYDLSGTESTKDLLDILFSQGADMLDDLLVKLESENTLDEIPQDHSKETWSYKISKKDGEIDPNNPPEKERLLNMIRAYYPWPTVWLRTELKSQAKLVKLLPDDKIQVEGKNQMNFKDFINGYDNEGKELLEKLNLR